MSYKGPRITDDRLMKVLAEEFSDYTPFELDMIEQAKKEKETRGSLRDDTKTTLVRSLYRRGYSNFDPDEA